MKRFVVVLSLVLLSSGIVFSQQNARPANRRPNAAPAIQDAVVGFYIEQFPQQVEVTDEQFVKVLPILRQALRERREISARKTRTLNQLRMMVQSGDGSDDEIKRLLRELDKADADLQSSQEKFLNTIDPLLTPRQQARLRIFEFMIDQRIRRMIDRARNPGQNLEPPLPK